jgi:hypothetical protein
MTRRAAPHGGRRPLTAYHEAGHCLARLYFGHSFEEAVVRSPAQCRAGPLIDSRGRPVDCEGLTMGYNICPPIMSPEVVRLLQGLPAEHDAFARWTLMTVEVSLIEAMAGIAAEARHRRIDRAAIVLTGGDADWAGAEARASTWFPDAPDAALTLAEDRVAALVQSPAGWRAVEGMAAWLLAEGTLDCETAEDIFAAAYGCPVPAHEFWADRWPPSLAMLREAAA